MAFKSILFDFDGTLADSIPMFVTAYGSTLRTLGFEFENDKIVEICLGKKQNEICRTLKIPEKVEEFTAIYISNIKKIYKSVKLFPDVKEFLEFAESKNVKMGIASFAYSWYIDDMLNSLGIKRYFTSILGFDDVKKPKPDIEIVVRSAEKLGISKEEFLVVGDTKSDITMGKNAGCKTVLFFPKSNAQFYDLGKLKEAKPDFIITKFLELNKMI